jgi:phosphate transport system protein
MPRSTFDCELHSLQDELIEMSHLVDQAIVRALKALGERDRDLALQIIAEDLAINQAVLHINERCLVLLATQQPLATDLRIILSISSIASELERMGDHAEGIAKITLRMADEPLLKPLIDIPRMADKGRYLMAAQLQAFCDRDAVKAKELAQQDSEIDELYNQIFRELLVFMMQDPNTIRRATYLLWVAHNLERIADRSTNIGERVVFLATGQVEELNPTQSAR